MSPSPLLPLAYKTIGHFAIISGVLGGVLATEVDFRSQITLGSIIVGFLVIVLAGAITIRSKIANIWREEAEGERAAKERLQEELNEEKIRFAEFEKDQQEIRHDLKNKNAELKAQIKVMEAKTDLTAALEALQVISTTQTAGHHETHVILKQILDKLPQLSAAEDVGELLVEIRDKLPDEPLSEPVSVHVEELKQPVDVHEVGKEGGDQ